MKIIALVVLIAIVTSQSPVDDLVNPWPKYGDDYVFKSYSGLITISEDNEPKRSVHYIFMESINNPQTDPVYIYFGGGPGCSVTMSLVREVGPYIIDKFDLSDFTINPHSTHHFANVLYLDIPTGVGYSENEDPNFVFNDLTTGRDAYLAIRKWFNAFTDFQDNSYFIGGESYSGMYVPYAAGALVEGEKSQQGKKINLKGLLIGNGVIVSDESWLNEQNEEYFIERNFCDYTSTNIMQKQCKINPQAPSCLSAKRNGKRAFKNINPYNMYDYCMGDSTDEGLYQDTEGEDEGSPCLDPGPLHNYFNDDAVQTAMRINPETKWFACNDYITQNYIWDPAGANSLIPFLHDQGIAILQYSGNQDDVVSLQYTLESFKQIPGLEMTQKWTPFARDDNGQLGGWTIKYNFLTLYIIRGAGHMAPYDQRIVSEQMFKQFLAENK